MPHKPEALPPKDQLLDGALSEGMALSRETPELSATVRDRTRPLHERLEAFEDIINLEIGDTPLSRVRNLERETGLRQLFVKFEGGNPSGTQKDRIAFAQCLDALRRGYATITIATCGNYGAALALAARLAGLQCHIVIPEGYHTERVGDMEREEAELERWPGTYEEAVRHSQRTALERDWYDANPGGSNTSLQLAAYAEVAYEIYDQLRDAPRIVAVPVSNGTFLAGIYRGFRTLYKRGKTSRIPQMVAGSSYHKNPIVHAWLNHLPTCQDLLPEQIKETRVNEPLINWHAFDGNEALSALRESKGWAAGVSDASLLHHARLLREREGLSVLPASAAGLIALLKAQEKNPFEGDRYVAVLTGRR
jgi:threonine synthase